MPVSVCERTCALVALYRDAGAVSGFRALVLAVAQWRPGIGGVVKAWANELDCDVVAYARNGDGEAVTVAAESPDSGRGLGEPDLSGLAYHPAVLDRALEAVSGQGPLELSLGEVGQVSLGEVSHVVS